MKKLILLFAILGMGVVNAQTKYLRVDYRGGTIHLDSVGKKKKVVSFGEKQLRLLKMSPVETLKHFEDKGWELMKVDDRATGNFTQVIFWFKKEE